MENNERQYGEEWPVSPAGFIGNHPEDTARGLNALVSRNPKHAAVYPIDGDAMAREAAAKLKARLHSIVVTARGKGTFDVRADD